MVLGIALVLAVEQIIHVRGGTSLFEGRLVLPFLAFVGLAFSIYHWGVTYLDRRYGAGEVPSKPGVFVDLLIGITELLALIGLSILLSRPVVFAVGALAVLSFEVLAGVALSAVGNYRLVGRFPRTYLRLNVLSALVLGLALFVLQVTLHGITDLTAGVVVFGVALARTASFYGWGFDVLFKAETH